MNNDEVLKWLGKRRTSLENNRLYAESLWKTIRLYFEPSIGKALLEGDPNQKAASRDDDKIFNSTPRQLLGRLASGLQSGITNQSKRWFRFGLSDSRAIESRSVRDWLCVLTEVVESELAKSNAYPALDQMYMHLAQNGTSCALVTHDSNYNAHVEVIDEGAYWIAENRSGRVDTVMRRLNSTAQQIAEDFGYNTLPDAIKKCIDEGRNEDLYEVWNLVCPVHIIPFDVPLGEEMKFASFYWLGEARNAWNGRKSFINGAILDVRGFDYNPIVCPRWMVCGSPYGTGPAAIGLPDVKELQRLELDRAKIVAGEASPPLMAPVYMKGVPINRSPDGITYYQGDITGKSGLPIQRLFQTGQSLEAVNITIEQLEARVRQTFYVDLFAMLQNLSMQNQRMTATEVNELASEKVALLGPVLTRLNWDMLDPLVSAYYAIVQKRVNNIEENNRAMSKLATPPQEVIDKELKIEYISSLHVSQKASTLINELNMLVQFGVPLAQIDPAVLDAFDTDKMLKLVAESLFEHGCVRDEGEIEAIRQQRQAAQQAQMQQMQHQQQMQDTQALKNMSETKLNGGGSVLDALANSGELASLDEYEEDKGTLL